MLFCSRVCYMNAMNVKQPIKKHLEGRRAVMTPSPRVSGTNSSGLKKIKNKIEKYHSQCCKFTYRIPQFVAFTGEVKQ